MADDLRRSLPTFEHALVQTGAVVARRFRPGIGAPNVERLMGRIGLAPSAELLEWFAWHDGAVGSGTDLEACSLVPGAVFHDLEMLCEEYIQIRRSFDEVEAALPFPSVTSVDLWDPSWFPILRLWAGCIAVDLADSGSTLSPVHVIWFDAELEHRKKPLWPSMHAFVLEVLDRIESGIYRVDRDGVIQGPDVDQTS